MIERREFICEWCGKKFREGSWTGCDGELNKRHALAANVYYSQYGSLQVCLRKPTTVADGSGRAHDIPGKTIQFVMGQYRTRDPEEQLFLSTYGNCITREQFEELNLSPEVRAARTKTQLLEERRLRQEAEEKLKLLQAQQEEAKLKKELEQLPPVTELPDKVEQSPEEQEVAYKLHPNFYERMRAAKEAKRQQHEYEEASGDLPHV
jgi:hypothetical protein